MMNRILIAGATSLLLAAGCATAPKNLPELDQARAAVEKLTSDPIASQSATRELQMARTSLERADQAWKAKEPSAIVIHLAYLAERQAEIGEVRLGELRAREQIARGEADRNAVLLEAREREAQLASSRANANAQDAETARQAARSADQRAQAAQEELEASKQEFAELQAKQTERGMVLTLGDVLFDTAQAELKPGATKTLDRLAQFMRDNDGTRVMIEGYTDSRGSSEYNQDLSRRRAAAVAEALESRGTDRNRVNVAGRGEDLPVANNDTAAGRQLNRRVEIVFSNAAGKFADDLVQR